MKKSPKFNLRLPKKITSASKRSKMLYLGLSLLVLAVLITGVVMLGRQTSDQAQEREVTRKLDNLNNKEEVTCQEVIDEIGSVSPDKVSQSDAKTQLLERQMTCFSNQLRFDEAIVAAEELKQIYSSESDTRNVERINYRIADMKTTKEQLSGGAAEPNDTTGQ